jgi:hypothetical protein
MYDGADRRFGRRPGIGKLLDSRGLVNPRPDGTWVAVQFGIGEIATAIGLDNRFNVESYDSTGLNLRFGMKYSG